MAWGRLNRLLLSLLTLLLPILACSLPGGDETASISGVLWHDVCRYSGGHAGEPVVLIEGCVQWGEEEWGAQPRSPSP